MEEHHVNTVTSDKDSIFILYSHVTAWNDNLMIPFYRTDNDIAKFFSENQKWAFGKDHWRI